MYVGLPPKDCLIDVLSECVANNDGTYSCIQTCRYASGTIVENEYVIEDKHKEEE